MNKHIMFIWGFIVVLICGYLVYLGKKDEDRIYLKMENNIFDATKLYINDKELVPDIGYSVVVNIDELILNEYIEYSEDIDKYCLNNVVVSRGIINSSYKMNINCEYNVYENIRLSNK